MSRRAAFKQAGVTRALRGAVAAGLRPSACSIAADGSIKLEFSEVALEGLRNPLDRVLGQ